jgi:hypothetical protein
LHKFGLGGIGEVDDSGVAGNVGELVGVGDEQLAVVIEERETDGCEAVGCHGADEGMGGVVLERGCVEDQDGVVVAGRDVDGVAVGRDDLADRAAACVEEAKSGVAFMLRTVVGGRRSGLRGVDHEEAAVGVGRSAEGLKAVAVLQLRGIEPGQALVELLRKELVENVEACAVGGEGDGGRGARRGELSDGLGDGLTPRVAANGNDADASVVEGLVGDEEVVALGRDGKET